MKNAWSSSVNSARKHSLKSILIVVFGFLLLSGIVLNVFQVLNSGNKIVNNIIIELADNKSRETLNEITRFLDIPDAINHSSSRAITSNRVEVNNAEAILSFLWDLSERENAYAVSGVYIGDKDGMFSGLEVGGASQSPDDWEISHSSPTTNGLYTDYAYDSESVFGEQLRQLGPYDPRIRPWYIAASESPHMSIWTDVYEDFDTKSPTITRARAIVDDTGDVVAVAGVDLFLTHLQQHLATLAISENSEVFIADANGHLLGYHAPAFPNVNIDHTVSAGQSGLRFTDSIATLVASDFGKFSDLTDHYSESLVLDDEFGRLNLSPMGRGQGVEWTFGIFVPRSDYRESWWAYLGKILPFSLLTLLVGFGTLLGFTHYVTRPLTRLDEEARVIATGDFEVDVDVKGTKEIRDLAESIDHMRLNLSSQFSQLSEQRTKYETILNSITDGVISTDHEGNVTYMNPVAEEKIGIDRTKAIGKPLNTVFDKNDVFSWNDNSNKSVDDIKQSGAEMLLHDMDGHSHPVFCRCAPLLTDQHTDNGAVLVFSDLSEKLKLQSELQHQASHDSLTNLVNRREFELRVDNLLSNNNSRAINHALCYMDLDQFKVVNDQCGHVAGDELLKQVARLFQSHIRASDTVARLGGDEFGLLLENCNIKQAQIIAKGLLKKMDEFRFQWKDNQFNVGISIGLISIDDTTGNAAEAMRDADSACYLAKDEGRNCIHLSQENDQQLAERRQEMQWVEKIDRALEMDNMVLFAQVIDPLQSIDREKLHFEVLIRMLDPEQDSLIPPGAFLPAAERYHLATRIDRWVVEHLFSWLNSEPSVLNQLNLCSVNLSGQSVGDSTFLPFLVNQLAKYSIPPEKICFEVTETSTIANLTSAILLIEELKKMGASFALDDFGSGLSSFEYLKTLPVDYLKIDGLFVKDIADDPLDFAMVRSINEIGHIMGIKTIAEFVETTEIRKKLQSIGIDFAQGYGIERPKPIIEIVPVRSKRDWPKAG